FDGSPVEAPATVRLVPVVEYGAKPDTQDPTTALAGGAVLGQIAAVVDDPEGRVYVLDAAFKKIAVFQPSGALDRVLLGGHGKGPGEFQFPTSLARRDDGTLAVFDFGLGRLTLFSPDGTVLSTRRVPRSRDIAFLGADRVIGTRRPGRDRAAWVAPLADLRPEAVRDTIGLRPIDRRHSPFGPVHRMGATFDGRPLIASHRPGFWLNPRMRGEHWVGFDLLRGAEPRRYDDTDWTPGATVGVGQLSDGRIVLAYVTRDLSGDRAPEQQTNVIDILDPSGRLLARAQLPQAELSSMTVSRDGRTLLLPNHDPFPRVVRYRIEP
ncbi:MAG: hypothetical protein D6701_12375, partial [Gemmatimonadetes bacterium]